MWWWKKRDKSKEPLVVYCDEDVNIPIRPDRPIPKIEIRHSKGCGCAKQLPVSSVKYIMRIATSCPNGHLLDLKVENSPMKGFCPVCKAQVCVPDVVLKDEQIYEASKQSQE